MKKYNEGYTLPFVLVVFLVTSLVAVSILTVSIHNLHGQKASVGRMESQYAAQGAIEAVAAELRAKHTLEAFQGTTHQTALIAKVDAICGEVSEKLGVLVYRDTAVEPTYESRENNQFVYTVNLVSTDGTVGVSGLIQLTGTISSSTQEGGTVLHTVSNPATTYLSYSIDTITEDGGAGE